MESTSKRKDEEISEIQPNSCCCNKCECRVESQIWSQLIATAQILWSIALLYRAITLLITPEDYATEGIITDEANYEDRNFTELSNNSTKYDYIPYAYVAFSWKLQLAQSFMCLALGCILFTGIYLKNAALLLIWLIASWMGLVILLLVIMSLLSLICTGHGLNALAVLCVFLLPFGIQYSFIHLVSAHRQSLISGQQSEKPAAIETPTENEIMDSALQFSSVSVLVKGEEV